MLTHLLEHPEEHLPAEVAERGRLVGMDGQRVGPDFNILITQGLGVDHQLDQGILLDISDGVDHLEVGEISG